MQEAGAPSRAPRVSSGVRDVGGPRAVRRLHLRRLIWGHGMSTRSKLLHPNFPGISAAMIVACGSKPPYHQGKWGPHFPECYGGLSAHCGHSSTHRPRYILHRSGEKHTCIKYNCITAGANQRRVACGVPNRRYPDRCVYLRNVNPGRRGPYTLRCTSTEVRKGEREGVMDLALDNGRRSGCGTRSDVGKCPYHAAQFKIVSLFKT